MVIDPGSFWFLAFLVAFLAAVIYGLYTRAGSGIDQHPYRDAYGDAPGAWLPSSYGNDRSAAHRLTRGTR